MIHLGKMKTIDTYIIEKLHLNKDIKTHQYLDKDEWFSYINKLGGKVIEINKKFYRIILNEYDEKYGSPDLVIYVSQNNSKNVEDNYFRARDLEYLRTYWSKDIKIVFSKDGDDKEYFIKKDELDKNDDKGWSFTTYNAEVIVNKLKEISND